MRHSRRLAVAAVVLGLASELVAFDVGEPDRWILDLVTGWVLIGGGLFADPAVGERDRTTARGDGVRLVPRELRHGRRARRVGRRPEPLSASWPALPRGDHLPDGTIVLDGLSRGGRSLLRCLGRPGGLELAGRDRPLGGVLRGDRRRVRTFGRARRRFRLLALEVCGGLSVVIVAGAVTRMTFANPDVGTVALLAYEVILCAVAATLTAGHVTAPAAVTDLVVELGETRLGSLRAARSRARGPSLEVGYWRAEAETFVDPDGRVLDLPSPDRGRAVTVIEGDDLPIAALVHDPTLLEDPALVDAVAAAARLAIANARLQARSRRA